MNLNILLFQKINQQVGTNKYLDWFGRVGAELAIVAMIGWFVASDFILNMPGKRAIAWPILFLGSAWVLGWLIDIIIGLIVKEPRPHITHPNSKLLFKPLMSWKSFPSDHAMSAWLIFFVALILGLPWVWGLLLLALWISWGRVYAGVHYPFDIVGGLIVAAFISVIVYYTTTVIF